MKNTEWEPRTGKIVEGGYNRMVTSSVDDDGGCYYISIFEVEAKKIPTGTVVSYLGGHPGQHRGVAKDIKVLG